MLFEVWKIPLGINDNTMKTAPKVRWAAIELVVIGIHFTSACFKKCREFPGTITELMKALNNTICFDLFLPAAGFF